MATMESAGSVVPDGSDGDDEPADAWRPDFRRRWAAFATSEFSPTFATYRMNATDDAHMSRVVMAWAITNKIVQPLFIAAAGALAAVTSAKTALIALSAILLTGIALLPWRRH